MELFKVIECMTEKKETRAHGLFDSGNEKAALKLVEEGVVGVNVRDRNKRTLLHKAVDDGDLTGRLIAAGADLNAKVREVRVDHCVAKSRLSFYFDY